MEYNLWFGLQEKHRFPTKKFPKRFWLKRSHKKFRRRSSIKVFERSELICVESVSYPKIFSFVSGVLWIIEFTKRNYRVYNKVKTFFNVFLKWETHLDL